MNDCPRVRRTFWYPVFLPMGIWMASVSLLLGILDLRDGEKLPGDFSVVSFCSSVAFWFLLAAVFQVVIGLPLLSLFDHVRRFWPRVWLAGFAALLVSAPLSLFGSYLEALLIFLPPFTVGAAYTHYRNRQPSAEPSAPSVDPVVEVLVWFGIFLSAVMICFLVFIMQEPSVKTSSLDPWSASAIFLPTGALGFFVRRIRAYRWTAILACTVCLTGMSLLFYLDYTNKYLQYMVWISRSKAGLLTPSPEGDRK